MENKQKKSVVFVIIIIVLLSISTGIYFYLNKKPDNPLPVACTMEAKQCSDGSYVGRTGPRCEFSPCPSVVETPGKQIRQVEFNKLITMSVNEEVIFANGLSLTLKEIDDSRCRSGVQCIWQGELSALFKVKTGGSLTEIRLGTVNNKKVSSDGYTFSLESATEKSLVVTVSINSMSKTSGVSGYIHLGPICPVEKYPLDPNCADKPYVNTELQAIAKSSGVVAGRVKTNKNGIFQINLMSGTYLIKVTPMLNSVLPRCEQKEIVVTANKFTKVDISCDTGIR